MGSSLPSRRTERPVRWFASGGGVWLLIGASRGGSCGVPVSKLRLAAPCTGAAVSRFAPNYPRAAGRAARRAGDTDAAGARVARAWWTGCRAGQEASGQSWPAWLSWCDYRQPSGSPGLEAADYVCCAEQAQGLQGCGGKRGGVPLVAADDPPHVVAGRFGDPGRAGRVAAPFQVVAFDDDGAGYLAVCPPLELGPGVDEDRAVVHRA